MLNEKKVADLPELESLAEGDFYIIERDGKLYKFEYSED